MFVTKLNELKALFTFFINLTVKGSVLTIDTEYGPNYRIRAPLTGPNGGRLRVVTPWMNEEAAGTTKFVTLFPDKF